MAGREPTRIARRVLAVRFDVGDASAEVVEWVGLEGVSVSVVDLAGDESMRADLTWDAAAALHAALGDLLAEVGPISR